MPGCSFIWLFLSGYKALAFSYQQVTFCLPADIELQALSFFSAQPFRCCAYSFLLPFCWCIVLLCLTMLGHELPCSYVNFFQVFWSPADYPSWVSDDWDSKCADCCHFVFFQRASFSKPASLCFCVLRWLCSVTLCHCCRMTARFQDNCSSRLFYLSDPLISLVLFTLHLLTMRCLHFARPNVVPMSELNT